VHHDIILLGSMLKWSVEWMLHEPYQFDSHVECSQDSSCPSTISLHSWHPNLECQMVLALGQTVQDGWKMVIIIGAQGDSPTLVLMESPPVS